MRDLVGAGVLVSPGPRAQLSRASGCSDVSENMVCDSNMLGSK